MSRFYGNYSQYLGAQRCCDIKVQGPQGLPGPQGPASIGPMGHTGPSGSSVTGPTGKGCRGPTGPSGGPTGEIGPTGPTGPPSQWILGDYFIEKSTGPVGFNGIGYTGNVGIFGDLNVTGVIDPTAIILSGTGPNSMILNSENNTFQIFGNTGGIIYSNLNTSFQYISLLPRVLEALEIPDPSSNTNLVVNDTILFLDSIGNTGTIGLNNTTGNLLIDPSNSLIVNGDLDMSGNTIKNVYLNYDDSLNYPYLKYNTSTKTISYKELHYANLYNTTDITLPQNTIVDLSYNNITVNTGITYSGSNITFSQTGRYKIGTSILASESGGSGAQLYFWFNFNGTNIPNSSSVIYTPGNNSTVLGYSEIILEITNISQYVKIQAYSTSTGITIDALSSPALNVPASPSIITTVIQIV